MISAASADDHVGQLIALTERLTERLAAEARAFEARRPRDVLPTAADTASLANLYRHECARLKRDPGPLKACAPTLRAKLVKATEGFEAVLARHGRAVAAAKTVTEGLVQAIAEEVAKGRAAPAGYGPSARALAPDGSAIALNRRA